MPLVRRRGSSPSGLSVIEAAEPPEGETGLVWRNNGVYKVFLNSAWKDIDFYDGEWARGAGGDTVVEIDGYRYHKFTIVGNASFVCSQDGKIEYLVVAGGGGGGGGYSTNFAGGGGGGGLLQGNTSLTEGQELSITVGVGGGGGSKSTASPGTNGGNSALGDIVASGGGGGGGTSSEVSMNLGRDGGSGGGAGKRDSLYCAGGAAETGQGYGGQDYTSGMTTAGTGGGAGGDGASGGAGLEVWGAIYAAGGGLTRETGESNTGNGGGGGYSNLDGAPGGSGIVIIRYAI